MITGIILGDRIYRNGVIQILPGPNMSFVHYPTTGACTLTASGTGGGDAPVGDIDIDGGDANAQYGGCLTVDCGSASGG